MTSALAVGLILVPCLCDRKTDLCEVTFSDIVDSPLEKKNFDSGLVCYRKCLILGLDPDFGPK